MEQANTTKMSSKGQIVIPDKIRRQLGLRAGDRFLVVGDKDVIVLKNISPPSLDEFDTLIAEARSQARKVGLKKSDIQRAIRESREDQ